MKSLNLSVHQLWVMVNPNGDMEGKPVENRLLDLHQALRLVHAGLWINTKPHAPRFRTGEARADGRTFATYLVCFNGRTSETEVLHVVEQFGFCKYVELPANPSCDTTLTVLSHVAA